MTIPIPQCAKHVKVVVRAACQPVAPCADYLVRSPLALAGPAEDTALAEEQHKHENTLWGTCTW